MTGYTCEQVTSKTLHWRDLTPPSLDMLGLDAAVKTYVKEWSHQFGVDAVYQGVAVGGLRLAAEAETNLYRIFQEALPKYLID